MKRRKFITLLGGAAAWPLLAHAQQRDRVRRIGVLVGGVESGNPNVDAFIQALAGLGWTVGRNVQMDLRGASGDINRMRALAQETRLPAIAIWEKFGGSAGRNSG